MSIETSFTILVVDDDPALRDGLVTIAGRIDGVRVVQASDGAGALRAVSECRPDMIFLDLGLPDMTGLDVCEQIKKLPANRAVRIWFISGEPSLIGSPKVQQVGAAGVLIKPFGRDLVRGFILKTMEAHGETPDARVA